MTAPLFETLYMTLMWYLVFAIWYVWLYQKWARRPVFINAMRFVCLTALVSMVLFACLILLEGIFDIINGIIGTVEVNLHYLIMNTLSAVTAIILLLICYFIFRKPWWYYVRTNHQTIQADWYVQKYLSMHITEDNFQQAYAYLDKAADVKPDCIFAWALMALLKDWKLNEPDTADAYLAKARQILATANDPTQKEKAIVEAVTGDIMLGRNKVEEGLSHLKTACELLPSAYQAKYEKALAWANDDEEPEDPHGQ